MRQRGRIEAESFEKRGRVHCIQLRLVIGNQPRPALNYLDVSGPYSSRYILLTCFLSQNENSKVAKLVSDSSIVSERRAGRLSRNGGIVSAGRGDWSGGGKGWMAVP